MHRGWLLTELLERSSWLLLMVTLCRWLPKNWVQGVMTLDCTLVSKGTVMGPATVRFTARLICRGSSGDNITEGFELMTLTAVQEGYGP